MTGSSLVTPKLVLLAEGGERRGVARPLVAEAKVEADHDVADAEPAREHVVDEALGRFGHQMPIERQDVQVIDPEPGQEARLDPQRGQSRRRLLRRQDLARMRLEGDHAERRAEVAGPRPRGLDQGAVAAVHAVEIADRDHPVQGGLRQIPIAPVDLHRRLMPAPRRRCKEISPAPVLHGPGRAGAPIKTVRRLAVGPRLLRLERPDSNQAQAEKGRRNVITSNHHPRATASSAAP